MKVLISITIILVLALCAETAVLDNIYFNAQDASYKNYGQIDNSKSFYLNPSLLSTLANKELSLNYINFYRSAGYNLHSFGFSFAFPLNKLKSGLYSQMFSDITEKQVHYTETRLGAAFSFSLKKLNLGLLFHYSMSDLSYDTEENIIPDNKYSHSQLNIIPGLSYKIERYHIKVGYTYYNNNKQVLGGAYYFSPFSVMGLSIRKNYSSIELSLTGTVSIIKDKFILNFGLSPYEYSPGLRIKMPDTFIKKPVYLNYTMCYNIYLKDTHYMSMDIQF